MEVWKWGAVLLVGAVTGAFVTKQFTGGRIAAPRSRNRRSYDHRRFDLEFEICNGADPREVKTYIQLKPVKGGWKTNRFKAKMIPRRR